MALTIDVSGQPIPSTTTQRCAGEYGTTVQINITVPPNTISQVRFVINNGYARYFYGSSGYGTYLNDNWTQWLATAAGGIIPFVYQGLSSWAQSDGKIHVALRDYVYWLVGTTTSLTGLTNGSTKSVTVSCARYRLACVQVTVPAYATVTFYSISLNNRDVECYFSEVSPTSITINSDTGEPSSYFAYDNNSGGSNQWQYVYTGNANNSTAKTIYLYHKCVDGSATSPSTIYSSTIYAQTSIVIPIQSRIKVFDGTSYVKAVPKIYNGSSWTKAKDKLYTGTSWS